MSSRTVTDPFVRAAAAVSASRSSTIAAATLASGGTGDGNAGLPVIRSTMVSAYEISADTGPVVFSAVMERLSGPARDR